MRAVDDHVIPLARTAPRGVDRGKVVLRVAPEPHLHPPEAVRDVPRGLGLELVDVVRPEEPARVGGAAVHRGAEQLPDRRTLLLAAQVPERDVETADRGHRGPLAPVPAGQVVEPAPELLRLGRVAADEMRREVLLDDRLDEVGMAVGGPDPRLAAVGLDQDERCDAARHLPSRVPEPHPGGIVETQVDDLDVLDLHGSPWSEVAMAIAGSTRSRSRGKTGRVMRVNGRSRMSGGVGPGRSRTKKPFITPA